MLNYGKKFEKQFEKDWDNCFPDTFLLRLPDQQSRYYGTSRNICDYIAFNNQRLYLLELKSIKGGTFPLSNLKQYELLANYSNHENILVGVIIWFREKDRVVFVPIDTFTKLYEDKKKSFNVKYIDSKEYNCLGIPSVKKRTLMTSDYRILNGSA